MTTNSTDYLNRELSWLEYNQRFLDEACDSSVPLLERMRCLALTGLHLDEFFMVRIGGLKVLADRGCTTRDISGMTAAEQLEAICRRTRQMVTEQYACFSDLERELAHVGIRRISPEELGDRQVRMVETIFANDISSILTPLAVSAPDQFPPLPNQSLVMAVRLQSDERIRHVLIPFGNSIHRFLTLVSEGGYTYLLLEDAVNMFINRMFPEEEVLECQPFRFTRHADRGVQQDLAGDLFEGVPGSIDEIPANDCIRMEIDDTASQELIDFILASSNVTTQCVFKIPGPLDLAAFAQLHDLPGFQSLSYEAWPPQSPPDVDLTTGIFDTLSRRDILLHHPYDSFDAVIRLVEEAADDPDVVAIKQTLYGTDRNSPLVEALRRAAENEKYVTAILELKPRFRDAQQLEWAKTLEQASVQVIYGIRGLRTHAKLCIVVRREPNGIQRYVHFGTGDYNEMAARRMSDVSVLTNDEGLGLDATDFFNSITSHAYDRPFRKLDAAPSGMRTAQVACTDPNGNGSLQGWTKGVDQAQLNALGDKQIIDALYRASQQGVKIMLNICGLCCLRPGVKGLSENIRVVNVVDRFREHSRIIYFHNGGEERVFISSADWMPRNFDRRAELLVPIQDATARRRLVTTLDTYFRDNVKAAELQSDGTMSRIQPKENQPRIACQEVLYNEAVAEVKRMEQSRPTAFEPHRAADASS